MRPLVLIIASIFIKAFSIWQRLQASNNSNNTKDKENETNETNEQKDNIEQDSLNKVVKFYIPIHIFIITISLIVQSF